MDLDENVLVYATNVGAVVVAALFPSLAIPAAIAGPAVDYILRDKAERAARHVVEALKEADCRHLDDKHKAELVPMVYRIIEATRQGEYEHTLKVLAAFIAGELKQEIPEAGSVARMARRLEGLSSEELRLIARIAPSLMGPEAPELISSVDLAGVTANGEVNLGTPAERAVLQTLNELSSRGFLVLQMGMSLDALGSHYWATESLYELIEKAGTAIPPVADFASCHPPQTP